MPKSNQIPKDLPATKMTLLDIYAGQAIAGLCANNNRQLLETFPASFADIAYNIAIAMLSRRNNYVELLNEETNGNQSV